MRSVVFSVVMLCFLLTSPQISAQQMDDKPLGVFYAGAYYDVPPPGGNETSKYLVGPLARKADNFTGDELTAYVEDVIKGNKAFSTKVAVAFGADAQLGKDGGALAIYIPRAQHDQVKYSVPGAPDIYLTTISISVAIDVFTDKAAESNNNLRLEGLYSRLLVGEQSIKSRAPLDDAVLASSYGALFNQTLADLLNDAADEQLGRQRERANATFQLSEFLMPKGDKFPPEIAQLIGSGSDIERMKLSLEFLHLVNKRVSDEVKRRNYTDVALVSPPTAWAVSNVGELLAKRLVGKSRGGNVKIRFFLDPNAEQAVDARLGNLGPVGYVVKPALVRASTKTLAESEIQKAKIFAVTLLTRIYLPKQGQEPKWVPVTVPEQARTAKGVGGADIDDVAGMERVTSREIAMTAMRAAAKDLAPGLVDLMRNIADNRVENR